MGSFSCTTTPVASKQYKCFYCDEIIHRGDMHVKRVGARDGDFSYIRAHADCDIYAGLHMSEDDYESFEQGSMERPRPQPPSSKDLSSNPHDHDGIPVYAVNEHMSAWVFPDSLHMLAVMRPDGTAYISIGDPSSHHAACDVDLPLWAIQALNHRFKSVNKDP
jgi:hypothetical protein